MPRYGRASRPRRRSPSSIPGGRTSSCPTSACPGEDGYSLIRRVRAREARHGRAIAAVALTAYARADDRRKALSAGFQMHVPKPIDGDDLIGVVVRARAAAS